MGSEYSEIGNSGLERLGTEISKGRAVVRSDLVFQFRFE